MSFKYFFGLLFSIASFCLLKQGLMTYPQIRILELNRLRATKLERKIRALKSIF